VKSIAVGLVKFSLSLCVIALAFVGAFRAMNSMMVYDGAQVLIDDVYPCPATRTDEGVCLISGSLGHELWSGNATITTASGATYSVPANFVRGTFFESRAVRYEPFGKVVSAAIGFAILVGGSFLALAILSPAFRRRVRR